MSSTVSGTQVFNRGWSFAASADSVAGLKAGLMHSCEVELDRKFDLTEESKARMQHAIEAAAEMLLTGLWGSGPFTVSLSGSQNSLYIAVTVR